jgi:hypothetical protein
MSEIKKLDPEAMAISKTVKDLLARSAAAQGTQQFKKAEINCAATSSIQQLKEQVIGIRQQT